MKVRILYNKNGSISVFYPARKSKRPEETEEQWYKRVADKSTPEGVEYDDVDSSEIPTDRSKRNCWTGKKGKGISIGNELLVHVK